MSDMALIMIMVASVAAFALLGWLMGATLTEAQRKLRRQPTTGELLFAALTVPYSIAYVWLVMPEPKQ